MTLATQTGSVSTKRDAVTVSDNALSMGIGIISGKGSGKTTLLGELSTQFFQKGYPQVLFDPLGTLTPAFLFRTVRFLQHIPLELHRKFWERIRYVDLGAPDFVTPFPIYYGLGKGRSLSDIARRYLTVLRLSNPALVSNAPVSWPAMRRVGIYTGMVLASLSYQLTEAEDLLFHTSEWDKQGLFAEAIKRCPEAARAVSYFRNQYLSLSRSEKSKVTSSFLDHIFSFAVDDSLRAVFCAQTPGIDWQDVEEKRQTVILDFRNVLDDETRRFALLWVFFTLYEFLKQRGRKEFPFGVLIDEFAALTQQVSAGENPLAVTLDEFINQYMRNNNIWFTCAFQSIKQIDEQLRNTVLSLGTYVFGKTAKMGEARFLADALFTHNPYRVKRYHNVWGKMDLPPGRSGRFSLDDDAGYFVLEQEPQYMELNEQLELSAQKLNHLRLFEFLLRPATREGEVSQSVIPISIEGLVHDQETGEFLFPDRALVDRLRAGLAANTGIPLASILKEQEARLLTPTPQQPDTKQIIIAAEPVAASESADGNGRQLSGENQPVRLENGAHPEPHTAKKNPSLPIPDDTERQFLSFISEHPDTPVSELYKALGVGVWKGNKIRESLKAKGLLAEVELRTGSTTAGRPAKFVILTFQAFQLFGIAPPHGRGGVLHRHLQHDIADRATGKGYTVTCEKVLDTGAIVDVHLEKGQTKIAVEIAVLSTPDREIGHIRNCLTAGYDQVYGIFADDELLARTATTLRETFSVQETERVRLMSLRQLPHVGEG